MLMKVFQISWKSLMDYGLAFALLMAAFSSYVYMVFGPSLKSYSSFAAAVENLLAALIGGRMFTNTELSDTATGRLFFVSFISTMIFLMTNVLISILNDAMDQVQAEMNSEQNRSEFLNYMGSRIVDLLGIDLSQNNKSNIKQQAKQKGTILDIQVQLELP